MIGCLLLVIWRKPFSQTADDPIAGLFRERHQRRIDDLIADFRHLRAILDQIRHLEHAEGWHLRRHHRRGQRQIDGAELELLHQLAVAAELARAVHRHLRLAAKLGIGALGEFLRRLVEQRAGFADMAELDLGLRQRGSGDERQDDGGRQQKFRYAHWTCSHGFAARQPVCCGHQYRCRLWRQALRCRAGRRPFVLTEPRPLERFWPYSITSLARAASGNAIVPPRPAMNARRGMFAIREPIPSSWPGIAVRRTASLRSPMSRLRAIARLEMHTATTLRRAKARPSAPLLSCDKEGVDARDKRGHDGWGSRLLTRSPRRHERAAWVAW